MAEKKILSQEGYDKLVKERDELISVKRKEVSEQLKYAISQGDLSENADYDAAKDAQMNLEERIAYLDEIINNCEIANVVEGSKVGVGTIVEIEDVKTKETFEFTIVGATESDPLNNKITIASPIGERLKDHEAGDTVEIEVQGKIIGYKILSTRVK